MQKRKKTFANRFPGSYQELVDKAQVIVRKASYYNILRPIISTHFNKKHIFSNQRLLFL